MAGSNKVEIEVRANVSGTETVDALGRSLHSTGGAATRMGSDAGGAAVGMGTADTAARGFASTSGRLREGMASVSEQLASAKEQLLAFVGVGMGQQGLKDVTALADGYKSLEARVKLATGQGQAFDAAFAGVFEVAKRTSSAVQETGLLFTKLAEAGRALGVSQAQALGLTETINQSIQLSGASAEASRASITQLVQGLQSGVLRGDEFNSVMEQSPRLAKALADGLGVTTGELRKMAEAGQLSSATVIKALQNQSDAVAAEFGKLPATVGRAMTNLTTAFTAYVGEADKAGGYTSRLASVIDALAGNLGSVATGLLHAGQTMAAMKVLSMAQDWLSASAAIQASTAATTANTVATAANTTATAAAAQASGLLGTAARGLARALAPLALVDLALNFKRYGTAIGEFAARLLGAKDRTLELQAADQALALSAQESTAARNKQAAALQEATQKTFGLSQAGAVAIAEFDKLTKAGDTSAQAIAKIGKDFDLATVPGIQNATSVLDTLAAHGKLSAFEFQKAWAQALKGQDLAVFEVQARAAFAGSAREAQRLAQVLDATLKEAIRRTGLDFDVISGGMGKAARSAINDTQAIIGGLDTLKAQGVDTAQALTASIGKGIKTADSQKAIEALTQQIQSLRTKLGDKLTDGLLEQAKQKSNELKDALDQATPGVNSLREAYAALGLKSSEALGKIASTHKSAWEEIRKDASASADTLQAAFTAYAQAAIAASGSAGSAQRAVTEAMLQTDAAAKGLVVAFDAAGKMLVQNQSEAQAALETTNSALGKQKDKVDSVTSALERQNAALERANAAAEKAIALENKRRGVDAEGFSADKSGNRIAAGGDLTSLTGIAAFLKAAGVADEAKARSIAREFADSQGNVVSMDNPGQRKYGGDTISMAALKAAERYTFGPPGSNGAGAQSPSSIPSPSTVNVRLSLPDGSTQTVPTTQQGAQALIAALQGAKLSAGY